MDRVASASHRGLHDKTDDADEQYRTLRERIAELSEVVDHNFSDRDDDQTFPQLEITITPSVQIVVGIGDLEGVLLSYLDILKASFHPIRRE